MANQELYVVRSALMSRVGFLKRLFTVFVLPALILAMVSFASAQEEKTDTADPSAAATSQEKAAPDVDPLKRPLTEKQKKQNSKSLKIELSKTYKKWLDEDVRWICLLYTSPSPRDS